MLMLKMSEARQNVPFPAVVEILIMEAAFELLREAGTRMPKAIGGTLGIVGGLIVGSAAVEAGIPVHVQTVLLRGINDKAETLAALFRECVGLGISPYYLFQLDLAPGTAHFRVPLKEGLSIYRDLGRLITGSGLPVYAVDLPGGGGKIRLHDGVIAGEEDSPGGRVYLLKDEAGKLWTYPATG